MAARVLALLDRIAALLAGLLALIGALALVVLIPLFGWLVFGRYVLNSTPTWVEQTSLLLIVLITFPVAAAGVRDETHLSISFIRDALPPRLAACLALLSYAVLAAFGVAMAMAGADLAAFGWAKEMPLIHLPDGLRFVPVSVCGAGIAFFSLLHLLRIGLRLFVPAAQPRTDAGRLAETL